MAFNRAARPDAFLESHFWNRTSGFAQIDACGEIPSRSTAVHRAVPQYITQHRSTKVTLEWALQIGLNEKKEQEPSDQQQNERYGILRAWSCGWSLVIQQLKIVLCCRDACSINV